MGRMEKADSPQPRRARSAVLARTEEGRAVEVGDAYLDAEGFVVFELFGDRLPARHPRERLVLRARVAKR